MIAGVVRRSLSLMALGTCLANAALANHDTDCTAAGGTNGPAQLDCTLPDFVTREGSTTILRSSFVYTPSIDMNPITCAVGTLSVQPAGQWLSIDTTVLNATAPPNFQEVEVSVDPTGLEAGIYEGEVRIALTVGTMAPQCPSGAVNGIVSVRLVILEPVAVPLFNPRTSLAAAIALGGFGALLVYRRRLARQQSV